MEYTALLNMLLGLSVEAFIVNLATFLARPKATTNLNDENWQSWDKFFSITKTIGFVLAGLTILILHILRG